VPHGPPISRYRPKVVIGGPFPAIIPLVVRMDGRLRLGIGEGLAGLRLDGAGGRRLLSKEVKTSGRVSLALGPICVEESPCIWFLPKCNVVVTKVKSAGQRLFPCLSINVMRFALILYS
jgi:hypothetical protein